MKSFRIWSYSGPHFPAFGLNTEQNNSEYGNILHSYYIMALLNHEFAILSNSFHKNFIIVNPDKCLCYLALRMNFSQISNLKQRYY